MAGLILCVQPLIAAIGLSAAILLAFGVSSPLGVQQLFMLTLSIALAGYATLGRGFAHLGVWPFFPGELVLAIGLVALLFMRGGGALLGLRVVWLLAGFILWGAARTAPFLAYYGANALRDAVVWGYGVFAIIVACTLLNPKRIRVAVGLYARLLPGMLVCFQATLILRLVFFGGLLSFESQGVEEGVPLIWPKGGDTAVHLAGAATFMALDLQEGEPRSGKFRLGWILWLLWVGCALVVFSVSRGGMLAVLLSIALCAGYKPSGRWFKPLVTVVALVLCFLLVGPSIQSDKGRLISPSQVFDNLSSVLVSDGKGMLSTTRHWRLEWWSEIVDYTVFGDYFWGGKGFGVNLADSDGFQVTNDGSLRSPHNGHLTILARSGTVGAALWLALQVGFGLALLRTHRRYAAAGDEWWSRVSLWTATYWLAFLVNASFDVFLEGPQGGIWFWSVFGFGLANIALERTRAAGLEP